MKNLEIPRIVRWTLSTGLLFLVVLTIMRICLFLFFNRQSHSFGDLIPSFFLGLRFDLRMVCVLMLLMLVPGSIPPFSPFRSRTTKLCWNIFFGLVVFG